MNNYKVMNRVLLLLVCYGTVAVSNDVLLEEFKHDNNLFTVSVTKDLYKRLEGSYLVSPLSAQTIMALTELGAKTETAAEIRRALRLSEDYDKIEATFEHLLPLLHGNKHYNLSSANKIYIKTGYDVKSDFKKTAVNVYYSDVDNIDFSLKDEAANTINSWIEQQTDNQIQNLVDSSQFSEATRVVLVSTLYFSGLWVNRFDTYRTAKLDFYKTATDIIAVDMMQKIETFNYYESSELKAQFLELPYEGGDVAMVIVLPKEIDGLAQLEEQLDQIFAVDPKFEQKQVNVSLPRFTVSSQLNMKDILKDLGIVKAFNENADFSGIAGDKGELFISDVIQKTFINITEAGTKAAAATEAIAEVESLPPPPDVDVLVNHPFLFYVRAKSVLIFAGRFTGA